MSDNGKHCHDADRKTYQKPYKNILNIFYIILQKAFHYHRKNVPVVDSERLVSHISALILKGKVKISGFAVDNVLVDTFYRHAVGKGIPLHFLPDVHILGKGIDVSRVADVVSVIVHNLEVAVHFFVHLDTFSNRRNGQVAPQSSHDLSAMMKGDGDYHIVRGSQNIGNIALIVQNTLK